MERPCIEPRHILATFKVADEQFIAHVANEDAIAAIYQQYMGGIAVRRVPVATLRRGQGYNSGWSWHTDPLEIQMAEVAMEACDGRPSDVESNLEYWLSLGTYCPWSAQITAIVELPPDADADKDGCPDLVELSADHTWGGQRDIFSKWDFFDTTGDGAVDLADALDALRYFGDPGKSDEGNLRDRYVPDARTPWLAAEANDGVDLRDVVANLMSFGDRCAYPG
jgi:hypothetical protein